MGVFSKVDLKRSRWPMTAIMALAFWLSGSVIVDFVIMPTLYVSGMMTQPGFTTAGYSIFWFFNRIELLCAAVVLTATLMIYSDQDRPRRRIATALIALSLLSVALLDTYALTPQMSALGIHLNLFEPVSEVPEVMNQFHEAYGILEFFKLAAGSFLLSRLFHDWQPAEPVPSSLRLGL